MIPRALGALAITIVGVALTAAPVAAQTGAFAPIDSARLTPALRRPITLSLETTTVGGALAAIARASGLSITYDPQLPGLSRATTVRVNRAATGQAILQLLRDTGLEARVSPTGAVVVVASTRETSEAGDSALIQGTVIARLRDLPVQGAVVMLLDSAAIIRARAISGSRGDFSMRVRAGARYRLRVLRIGFTPTTTDPIEITGDTLLALRIHSVPVRLETVTARSRDKCRVKPGEGLVSAMLWDQVKTALLATAITSRDVRYRFEAVYHTRLWHDGELRSMAMREVPMHGALSWQSLPPETLREFGYVSADTVGGVWFAAPDVDVLLSPYFEEEHCFQVRGTPSEADSIGLDFEPARRRRQVEIGGTMWLDRATQKLRSLDFHYVDVPYQRGPDSLAGGRVVFAEMPNGAWIITHWEARMPAATLLLAASRQGERIDPFHPLYRDRHVRVTEADLLRVQLGPDILWSRPTASFVARVRTADEDGEVEETARPAAGAFLRIRGSRREVRADSAGRAVIGELLPGPYLVEATTDYMEVLRRPVVITNAIAGVAESPLVEVVVESAMAAARRVCGRVATLDAHTALLVGTTFRDTMPAAVSDVWVTWPNEGGAGSGEGKLRLVGGTREDGRFVFCGVPRQRRLAVFARDDRDGATSVAYVTLGLRQVIGGVALVVHTPATP